MVAETVTVRELIEQYLNHARDYYRKNGVPTSEYQSICSAPRPLREQCENESARNFGPKELKRFREQWVERGVVREQVNKRVDRVRRMFRWAVAEEFIDPEVYDRLKAVSGLRKGRTQAVEGRPVQPVDDEIVDATLPFLNRQIRALVELLRLTGARPSSRN